MSELIETLKLAGGIVGPVVGALGVYFGIVRSTGTSPPATITTSQAELVQAVNDQTKTVLIENARLRRESNMERRSLKKDVAQLRLEVQECHTKHADCETNLSEIRAEVTAYMEAHPITRDPIINPHRPVLTGGTNAAD